jgi:hypothetical protein
MTDPTISYPLIIVEGLDVSLFSSIPEAERKLEGIDVAHGSYRGFDAEGRALQLTARGVKEGRFWVEIGTVHISLAESVPTHAAELEELLRESLASVGYGEQRGVKLEALVEACKERENHPC